MIRWSIVMPVFNESLLLPATLASLAAQQQVKFRLIVVDNGSDDASAQLAESLMSKLGIDGIILNEPDPGPVPALARGLAAVETELVATCDADTFYPPRYLAVAERLLGANSDVVMASAYYLFRLKKGIRASLAAAHQLTAALMLPRQAHNGAAGQCFRTKALRQAGGYNTDVWPYVLADHEVVHRLLKLGRQAWDRDHWCIPSDRRSDADAVRWDLPERLLYHLTPFALKDWYFYDFLGPRLASRGLDSARLRHRDWTAA
jgi:glycosyltransferase involved in cell wall biosynthesis